MGIPVQHPVQTDDVFVVRPGRPLRGELRVNGAKNSALKLMAAALLAEGTTTLHNVPEIADVPVMGEVLRGLGCDVTVDGNDVTITAADPGYEAPAEAVRSIRASIATLGPLVGRVGRATLVMPGGDQIGKRSIEMHLAGLEALGCTVRTDDGLIDVRAPDGLRGAHVTFDFPSVGATENVLMAAVVAEGRTVIENAAREPEIVDLCRMLVSMGATILDIGGPNLTIEGTPTLHATEHATLPDRIEGCTFAMAAALTGGEVTLTHVRPDDLHLPLLKLEAAGVLVDRRANSLHIKAGELRATNFVTLPSPGFPTDLQPQMMVLLTQADGTSRCTENVYESRFAFVDELHKLGADIEIDGHHAVIRGRCQLRGATLNGLDVRAGAAGVMAGLVAEGETIITGVSHIDRGYAGLIPRLQSLGADVERVPRAELGGRVAR